MTVYELIQELQNYPDDAVVQLAQQPSWPFANGVGEIVETDDVVYIGEGTQHGYLSGAAAAELGW